jgi:S-formylglutathione hydrolase FrmB
MTGAEGAYGPPATPGGHDWAYWDRAIAEVLTWLPLAPPEGAQ